MPKYDGGSKAFREFIAANLRYPDSALEAGVRLAVVEQVPDAVHGVLEDRGGGEHDHADGGIDERDDVEGGDKTGDLADEAEVFECFHGDRGAVSTGSCPSRVRGGPDLCPECLTRCRNKRTLIRKGSTLNLSGSHRPHQRP